MQNSQLGSSTSSSQSALVSNSSQTTSVAPSTPIGNFLTHLYKATFDRDPDAAGLNYWTAEYNQGYGCRFITQAFLQSSENVLRGELLLNSRDAAYGSLYIHEIYSIVLNRDADQAGSSYWASALQNGVSVQDLQNSFLNSAEFQSVCNSFGIQ